MIDTILLDMDGTLLPVDNDTFTRTYFKLLCAKVAPHGFAPEDFMRGLKHGMAFMIENDGSRTNCEAFWDGFTQLLGADARRIEPICDEFYSNEFNRVRDLLGINVNRRALTDMLRAKGYRLVLANNPMLPAPGTRSRLGWLGLAPDDFDLVTDYGNCTYCKPALGYYSEIFAKMGRTPEQCIMVGNSLTDDACAAQLGCEVYIVDDALEGDPAQLGNYRHGSFADFEAFAQALPAVR